MVCEGEALDAEGQGPLGRIALATVPFGSPDAVVHANMSRCRLAHCCTVYAPLLASPFCIGVLQARLAFVDMHDVKRSLYLKQSSSYGLIITLVLLKIQLSSMQKISSK